MLRTQGRQEGGCWQRRSAQGGRGRLPRPSVTWRYCSFKKKQGFQQIKVHVRRDFRKAAASIGASLKADVAAYHGRRDLAELSPWFEAFASPAGAYVQQKCV